MTQDRDHLSPVAGAAPPTALDFEQAFTAAEASPGLRRVWELADEARSRLPVADLVHRVIVVATAPD